jgi:hypothetical protein
VAPAEVTVTEPVDNDPTPVTSGTLHFEGTITNHAADSEDMTVHITASDGKGGTIDETLPVPGVAHDVASHWTDDIDVSKLADGSITFTITASYPFGGASEPVQRTVTITNI